MDPEKGDGGQAVGLEEETADAKASNVVGQLMNNPEVLSAIQKKLASMTHNPLHHLPKSVRRRVKALKKLQYEMVKMESKFYEEVHSLECKYAQMYAPLLQQRHDIVMGDVEPTDEQCDWPSDDEEDDELAEEANQKLQIQDSEEDNDADIKGIKGFWLVTLKNIDMLADMIQPHDEPILEHLTDIKVQFSDKPMGFSLEFHFSPNEYFTDPMLVKHYEMRSEPDETDPFSFEGPEIVACQGCIINWNKGKNVTVRTIKKKQKHQKHGTVRTVTKLEAQDSFFNFFSPPEGADVSAGEELDEDTEAVLAADFEIGHFIRERVVPRAVLYFTGEAADDDEDEDYEEGEEDEHDEDEEDDDDDAQGSHQQKQECKQQ